jgi:flagellar assembly protein FliH
VSDEQFRPPIFPASQGPAKVVPRDQLTAYDRWELPVLEERLQRAAEQLAGSKPAADSEPLPTAGDLHALQERAWGEGWQAGLEEGRAAVNARLALLSRAIEQASGLLAEAETTLAPRLLNLVVAMTREVIRAELRLQPEALLVVLREALAVMPRGKQSPNVHLHPEDVAWLREHPGVDRAWQLIADEGLGRNACRIEMGDSVVESALADRWTKVLQSIGRADAWQDASERGS